MTTHINGIVQITRQMHGVTGAQWDQLMAQRYDRILAAIRDGVDPDLISFAIGINDTAEKVQAQHDIARALAAEAMGEELVAA